MYPLSSGAAAEAMAAAAHGDAEMHGGLGCECNFCAAYNGGIDHAAASAASARVLARVPSSVEVVYSGLEVGLRVQSGGALSRCAPAADPCRQAFVDYEGGPGRSRFSWDPLTTLMAVRGPEAVACRACATGPCAGVNSVDAASGRNAWKHGPPSNQSYLLLSDSHAAGRAIDELLCEPPSPSAARSPSRPR